MIKTHQSSAGIILVKNAMIYNSSKVVYLNIL
jgi:hypothetical protein